MKTVFILVFAVHAYYGPAVSVSPFPYATLEACEVAAKAFRDKTGSVSQYGNCIPAEAPEPRSMTSPSAAEVRGSVPVVKLEWRKAIEGTLSSAETLIDTYRVWTHSEADGRWFWCLDGWESGDAQDEAGAKGAAQADYEQRIRSALNPDFLTALDTARAEIERLRHDNEMLTTGGIIEVAVWNPSVADYMNHWEGRVEVAESILTAAQERIAEMEGALGSVEREYVTEYAGRSYTRCTCCHVALSDGQPHLTNCAWTTLSPAVKEPK